ncbi:MAG: 50S ribosomal protein L18 [Chlamydiota bacterium]
MNRHKEKSKRQKLSRTMRVRKRLRGSSIKPRLCVVKTNNHIHVQLINDEDGLTIGSTSTLNKEFRKTEFNKKSKTSAAKLGVRIAEIANENNIREVIFDRGPHKYHGILAELANAARENGLQF